METALWLHGLSLTIPFNMTMSFPYGTNTKNIKEADICPIILRSHYSEGIIEIERLPGQFIKVYEVERVLVECLRPVHQVDLQIIAPAFKKYFQQNKIHLHKLFYYAQLFKVTDKLPILYGGTILMFSNANSFKAKIKNISKDKGIPAQQVQQHYLIEQVLKLISTSSYRDSFIVKGGYLIGQMIGLDKRTTMDLDVTLKGTRNEQRKFDSYL